MKTLSTFAIVVCSALALTLVSAIAIAADRPNVVLIMTDDQGYGDFGATGNPIIETPNIDIMASRSASMSTFYVCPVCAPTRASLMTGRYNYRTRAIDTYVGRAMMEPEEITLAEVLSSAGYATGIFGKWHLGDCYPTRAIDQGFEEALVHLGGGLAQPSEPVENERRYTDAILFRNGKQVETKGYCTDVYFDAASQFIEDSHQAGRPFFVYLPTNAPHNPLHDVPEKLREHYMQKDIGSICVDPSKIDKTTGKVAAEEVDRLARIAAMITNVDENVGRLFAKLNALGIENDTLVIFLVDNGPNSQRYVGPFRGAKTEVYEGGIRSPLWLHWPARLKPGATHDGLSAHIDLMPTILAACDVEPPKSVQFDGRSFLPLLESETASWPERTIVTQWHRADQPIRYHHFMIRDSQWKLLNNKNTSLEHRGDTPLFELYDLLADPGESNNLVEKKPEIVARLKHAYDQWFDDVSNTRPDNYAPPRIILGSDHENPTVLTRQDWRSNDGWHRGTKGHWLVSIAQDGPYDLRILLNGKLSHPSTVELRIGDFVARQKIAPDATSCEFLRVKLPAGDAQLSAVQVAGDTHRDAYQVFVTRR